MHLAPGGICSRAKDFLASPTKNTYSAKGSLTAILRFVIAKLTVRGDVADPRAVYADVGDAAPELIRRAEVGAVRFRVAIRQLHVVYRDDGAFDFCGQHVEDYVEVLGYLADDLLVFYPSANDLTVFAALTRLLAGHLPSAVVPLDYVGDPRGVVDVFDDDLDLTARHVLLVDPNVDFAVVSGWVEQRTRHVQLLW